VSVAASALDKKTANHEERLLRIRQNYQRFKATFGHGSLSRNPWTPPRNDVLVKRRAIGTPYRRRIGTPCSSPWISGEARSHQPAQRVAAG